MPELQLTPKSKALHAVRWFRTSGGVACEYFVDEHAANRRADKLEKWGKHVEVYVTDVEWELFA